LELRDLRLGVPGLAENLGGVLTEARRRSLDGRGGLRELDREAELLDLADLGLLVGDDHLPLADQLRLERLVEVEDRLDHRVVLLVELAPLHPRLALEDLLDLAVCIGVRLRELVLNQVLAAHTAAEGAPELG